MSKTKFILVILIVFKKTLYLKISNGVFMCWFKTFNKFKILIKIYSIEFKFEEEDISTKIHSSLKP